MPTKAFIATFLLLSSSLVSGQMDLKVDFSNNDLGEKNSEYWRDKSNAIASSKKVNFLYLGKNLLHKLDNQSENFVTEGISPSWSNFEELVSGCPNVELIDLHSNSFNKISVFGWNYISQFFKKLPNLYEVNLASNNLSDMNSNQLKSFFIFLEKLTKLKVLHLEDNNLSSLAERDIKNLEIRLDQLKKLHLLYLCKNDINQPMKEMLARLSFSLEHIDNDLLLYHRSRL
jgi:hypothetical protein